MENQKPDNWAVDAFKDIEPLLLELKKLNEDKYTV
jgi:hypothetical protein